MNIQNMFSASKISASGLSAEKRRLEVTANNVANAHTTGNAATGPYRRQLVVFTDAMSSQQTSGPASQARLHGVRIEGIVTDQSELPQVFDPGHPHADSRGFVTMPNVSVPIEMVDMMTASRAYEANLKALQSYRQMVEQSLSLLRG